MLENKPNRMSADAWLEAMWGVALHPIKEFVATKHIRMPGAIWIETSDGLRRHRGYGPRYVTRGTPLTCRFDPRHATVDVEVEIKTIEKDCTFTLNLIEWKQLEKTIKEN